MECRKFGKLDFKKFHPGGNLGNKLKTVEDLMLTKNKIPFIYENQKIKSSLRTFNQKKLGVLIVRNKKKQTTGIFTDGDMKRTIQKNIDINKNKIKSFMTKNPISVNKEVLAAKALSIMNGKKITSLIVVNKKRPFLAIGVVHIHNILQVNIS